MQSTSFSTASLLKHIKLETWFCALASESSRNLMNTLGFGTDRAKKHHGFQDLWRVGEPLWDNPIAIVPGGLEEGF